MKLKSKSLLSSLLIYFTIFSIGITLLLYFFQTILFNSYYRFSKTKSLEQAISKIEKSVSKENYTEELNKLAVDNDICISVIEKDKIIYSSDNVKYCTRTKSEKYKQEQEEFIKSNKTEIKKEITNEVNKKLLIYKKKDKE